MATQTFFLMLSNSLKMINTIKKSELLQSVCKNIILTLLSLLVLLYAMFQECNQELIFLRASFITEISKALMTLRGL